MWGIGAFRSTCGPRYRGLGIGELLARQVMAQAQAEVRASYYRRRMRPARPQSVCIAS